MYEQFADDLAWRARSEEEVLYPAAILVGDIIGARMAQKWQSRMSSRPAAAAAQCRASFQRWTTGSFRSW